MQVDLGISRTRLYTSWATSLNILNPSAGLYYLPLARLNVAGIQVTLFKLSKPELYWSRSIAVRGAQHNVQAQVLIASTAIGGLVIRSLKSKMSSINRKAYPIQKKDGRVTPILVLLSELTRQVSHEQHQHILVCVASRQCIPDLSVRSHCCDNVDFLAEDFVGSRV